MEDASQAAATAFFAGEESSTANKGRSLFQIYWGQFRRGRSSDTNPHLKHSFGLVASGDVVAAAEAGAVKDVVAAPLAP